MNPSDQPKQPNFERPNQGQPGSSVGPNGSLQPQQDPSTYFGQPYKEPYPVVASATQPQLVPTAIVGASTNEVSAKKRPNKLVIIIIAGLSLLVVLGILVALNSQGQTGKDNKTQVPQADSSQSQSLLPAHSIDLEQTSNAISQDLSSLDDEQNYPATSLDDKTLGL